MPKVDTDYKITQCLIDRLMEKLVPRVKRAVQSLSVPECKQLVDEALKLQTASEILARCLELANARYGDLLG